MQPLNCLLGLSLLLQNNEQYIEMNIPEYERLFDCSVDEQLQTSKMLGNNMKILEKYEQT